MSQLNEPQNILTQNQIPKALNPAVNVPSHGPSAEKIKNSSIKPKSLAKKRDRSIEKKQVGVVIKTESAKNISMAVGTSTTKNSLTEPPKMGPTLYRFNATGRFELQNYPTSVDGSSELSNSQLLGVNLNYTYAGPQNKASIDFGAGTFFKKNQSEFAVYDLYFQNMAWLSSKDSFSVGRKRMDWSTVDKVWNMGLWQPKFAIDPLRPQQQGLTGLFYEFEGASTSAKLVFSPLYIPNIGPDIREENGSLVSDSRWYRPPSNKFKLFGKDNKIFYKIDVGDLGQLVNNQGVAGQLNYHWGNGAWVRSAYAYKPQNEILLTREEYKNIDQSVNVTVRPHVGFQEVVGFDAGYEWEQFGASVSATSDRPIETRPEAGWAIQKPSPMQVYGLNFVYELRNFLRRDFKFQASYLKTMGGDIVDIKSDGSQDEITLFDRRTMFSNALKSEVSFELLRVIQKPILNRTSLMYELDQKGTLFNTQFEYLAQPKLSFIVGADILSVENESEETTFLNQFRANDRFYGGINYEF